MFRTKVIKEVLMCRPSHYSVSYAINPWMVPGSASKNLAQIQWKKLVKTYLNLGIKVHEINQKKGLPDMVFSTDQGIVFRKKFIVSNFKYPQRKGERRDYLHWFEKHKFEINFLPKGIFFEGSGDCLFFREILFTGTGFRTSKNAYKYLSSKLGAQAFPLKLINPYFYHLDTALMVLNEESVFYYAQAFDGKSQKLLKKIVPNLISLSLSEVRNFATNSVVTDHKVIINANLTTFKKRLEKLGYRAIEIDMSEFIKSGGASHCLTQVIKEQWQE